jgi:membrane protein required for colicin V production
LNPVDVIIVVTVLIGFILGYKDGFVRKLIGIIGFALAIISAAVLKDDLGRLIEYAFGMEFYLAEITGGVLIFFTVILIFTLLKRVIHPFDKVNNLINQLIGGVVGVVQLLYFLSAVFLLLNVFDIPGKTVQNESAFYSDTYQIIPVTIEFLNNYTPQTKEIFEDYLKDQDTTG